MLSRSPNPLLDALPVRELTPKKIVEELDRYIVGQADAKRAVAIAIRNRWRRRQLSDELRKELERLALPLLEIDDAELHMAASDANAVHLHLAGAYSGCPGVRYIESHLLAPIVKSVHPRAKLTVTSGYIIPAGAKRLAPKK